MQLLFLFIPKVFIWVEVRDLQNTLVHLHQHWKEPGLGFLVLVWETNTTAYKSIETNCVLPTLTTV